MTTASPSPFSLLPSPLTDVLQPFVDRNELAGAVTLVASADEILAMDTVGFSNIAAGKPMSPDALFWIASQTKPITATALMMLVDAGKVDVDAPVEKYLPEFKGQMVVAEQDEDHILLKKPSHPITVANALSHTAGLPFRSPIEEPTLDLLPLESRVRSYAMMPLLFDPDTRYAYSNAGTNTAGRIIEVVTGDTYEAFLQERLFDPLGMKDTTFWPTGEQVSRLANSYRPNAANDGLEQFPISQLLYPLTDSIHRAAMPAGGLFSTAADVGRFCQMILAGGEFEGRRYLSAGAIQQMTSRHTRPEIPESYGFCWGVGDESFGHGGAHATNMTIFPHRGLITVFLVQHAGFPGDGGKAHETFQQAALATFTREGV